MVSGTTGKDYVARQNWIAYEHGKPTFKDSCVLKIPNPLNGYLFRVSEWGVRRGVRFGDHTVWEIQGIGQDGSPQVLKIEGGELTSAMKCTCMKVDSLQSSLLHGATITHQMESMEHSLNEERERNVWRAQNDAEDAEFNRQTAESKRQTAEHHRWRENEARIDREEAEERARRCAESTFTTIQRNCSEVVNALSSVWNGFSSPKEQVQRTRPSSTPVTTPTVTRPVPAVPRVPTASIQGLPSHIQIFQNINDMQYRRVQAQTENGDILTTEFSAQEMLLQFPFGCARLLDLEAKQAPLNEEIVSGIAQINDFLVQKKGVIFKQPDMPQQQERGSFSREHSVRDLSESDQELLRFFKYMNIPWTLDEEHAAQIDEELSSILFTPLLERVNQEGAPRLTAPSAEDL